MMSQFQLSIPGSKTDITIKVGDVLYLLGANGTGKSSLVSYFFTSNMNNAMRISAHRQTWFESNTIDISPRDRESLENNFRTQDSQSYARYKEWNSVGRINRLFFDLIEADRVQNSKIVDHLRNQNITAANSELQRQSPLQGVNELIRLSNMPIEIRVEEGQKIIARKNGGSDYSVAELSDGERSAFLIASDVLSAKPGTLFLIDEPERHLHRSIVSPFLKLLFDRRKDCAFIVSTHELSLPLDTPDARVLLVRGCEYQGQYVQAWTVDLLESGGTLDDSLKRDILGSRRKILFVEGTTKSLDAMLYTLLFPHISVVPKEGCREVERAVHGLRAAASMHWISAYGIIDNDQRTPEDIKRLKDGGIWAISHFSVESLYYHENMIKRMAERQVSNIGGTACDLANNAITEAIGAANTQRNHLVDVTLVRVCRQKILEQCPTDKNINDKKALNISVDLPALRLEEEKRFDELIYSKNWNGLLTRYPLRESSALNFVVDKLHYKDRTIYEKAVLKLIQDDSEAKDDLRRQLGDLYTHITKDDPSSAVCSAPSTGQVNP
jgi:ABC-type Mn2+/Zn2+ transport system ATPase subunit